MHVNKVCFLVSKAYHLNYYQCIPIRMKNRAKFVQELLEMWNEYKQRWVFHVMQIKVNGAFKCLESELHAEPFQVKLVTCDAKKHICRSEWGIRELKDRIQCSQMIMGYKWVPRRFVIEIVKENTKLINSIPKENGLHMIQPPGQLVTGIQFRMPDTIMGQYVQGHIRGLNDTEEERTVDSLYIGQADNGSGHCIFKLDTPNRLSQ